MIDPKKYKRILIIEVNWLGDVLFSTPFIRAIRNKYKDAHIACMAVPRVVDMIKYNPRIDDIIVYDEKGEHKSLFGKWRLVKKLRKENFDLAILLHRSFTRAFMAYLAGIKKRTGYFTKKRGFILTHPVAPPDKPLHKVEYFLKIAKSYRCDVSNKDYEFFITDKETNYIESELAKNGIKKDDLLVVINPGANWFPKRWNEENFAKLGDVLIEKYNAKIIISGAKTDTDLAERIKNKMRKSPVIFCGKTDLKELGALLERADFVISADSGPMHIAVAMKTNVIALFGPTSPEITGPYGSGKYRVIQKTDSGCETPCYDVTCADNRCMDAIKVEDVLQAFEEMYAKDKG